MTEDRELDKRVATLMGWTDIRISDRSGMLVGKTPRAEIGMQVPRYSTDIAAAWTVVEKFRLIVGPRVDGWCATVGLPDLLDWYVADASAPRAICLAALKAGEKK